MFALIIPICKQVQGQNGYPMRTGHFVRFQDGELAAVDANTGDEGIENLQAFLDAMLPPGQTLQALVLTMVGQTSQFSAEGHVCRQLAATTRLELRQCWVHIPMLLGQAPNLRELVMERCVQRDEEDMAAGNAMVYVGGSLWDLAADPPTRHAVPASALPASLTRLSLIGTKLMEHERWPAMPGAAPSAAACCLCLALAYSFLPPSQPGPFACHPQQTWSTWA